MINDALLKSHASRSGAHKSAFPLAFHEPVTRFPQRVPFGPIRYVPTSDWSPLEIHPGEIEHEGHEAHEVPFFNCLIRALRALRAPRVLRVEISLGITIQGHIPVTQIYPEQPLHSPE
jgi:hypothetical protein